MDGSMIWWEGRWVARMMMTPAARPRATRSRVSAANFSRSVFDANGGGVVGVFVDDDEVDVFAVVAVILRRPVASSLS